MYKFQVFPNCLPCRLELLRITTKWVQKKVKAFTHLSGGSALSMFRNLWYGRYTLWQNSHWAVHFTYCPTFFAHPFTYLELCITLKNPERWFYAGWLHSVQVPEISIAGTCNFFPDLCLPFQFSFAISALCCLLSSPHPQSAVLVQNPITNTSIAIDNLLVPLLPLSLTALVPAGSIVCPECQSLEQPLTPVEIAISTEKPCAERLQKYFHGLPQVPGCALSSWMKNSVIQAPELHYPPLVSVFCWLLVCC